LEKKKDEKVNQRRSDLKGGFDQSKSSFDKKEKKKKKTKPKVGEAFQGNEGDLGGVKKRELTLRRGNSKNCQAKNGGKGSAVGGRR